MNFFHMFQIFFLCGKRLLTLTALKSKQREIGKIYFLFGSNSRVLFNKIFFSKIFSTLVQVVLIRYVKKLFRVRKISDIRPNYMFHKYIYIYIAKVSKRVPSVEIARQRDSSEIPNDKQHCRDTFGIVLQNNVARTIITL